MSRIPKTLHLIFGMAADFGATPWSLVHHVCLRSAIERIQPEAAVLRFAHEPTGPWWEASRGLVDLIEVEAPRTIHGRPLFHVAHQADVLRLQVLHEHGGIYLDTDMLVHRDFDPLLEHAFVLGRQGADEGLCNAVILAEPEAPFLRRWLASYGTFRSHGRDPYWDEHSVQVPSRLADRRPHEITVLEPNAFYWPPRQPWNLALVHETGQAPLDPSHGYATHLWQTLAWRYLRNLTPGDLRRRDTNFARWVTPFVEHLPDDYGRVDDDV